MIWKMTLKTQGAAGPSGLNTDCLWTLPRKRIFGEVAVDLRKALARLAKTMDTEKCQGIEAPIAMRLIPLDKNSGVRPIAIGKVFTRILGKCMMPVTREDVKLAAGHLQEYSMLVTKQEARQPFMLWRKFSEKEADAAILVEPQMPLTPLIDK